MTYPQNLSLVELARYYVNYRNPEILDELARRDKLNPIACDEHTEKPDNQMVFDFLKEVASAEEVANNESVKSAFEQRTDKVKRMGGAWEEAYEAGRRVGFKQGLKEVYTAGAYAQSCEEIRQGECNCGDLDVSFSGV